jgi:hypothetical protein
VKLPPPSSIVACFALVVSATVLWPAASAHAQLTKIFVASFGNDANDGSRGSPKRNFQPAHDAVATNGQIVVLDTAGYGTLSIIKSLTVTVPAGVTGFVTATSGNGVTVDAGTSGIVSLRGLTIEGAAVGIQVTTARQLHISDCLLRACTTAGVQDSSTAAVYIRDTAFHDNSRGLFIKCLTGLAPVSVEHCRFEGNDFGIRGEDNARVSARDCVANGIAPTGAPNSYGGFVILGGAGRNGVMFCDTCTSTNNGYGFASGPLATGGDGTLYLNNCTATRNDFGASAFGSSALITYGNNHAAGNISGQFFSTGSIGPN